MSQQASSASIIDKTLTGRGALISLIKDHFRAQNIIVVLDKHSDNRKVTFKCYYGGKYRNPLGLTGDNCKRQTTASTLAYLREKTGNQWTTRKEIYNEKVVARAEFLDGHSPIQALYDEISTSDFIFNVKMNSNGSISGLFFCHQKSTDLARRINVVFVMDCIYKTNRIGMLLLNIVGIMAKNSTFNAGFVFICNETEPMYVWALQSFDQREKSLFEYSTGRKCSKCGQAGHNARTCDMRESELC